MLIHWIFIYYYFLIRKSWMGEYQWVKFWFFIYQGLYKNHSFIIRRSWEGIHINETSIEFGSQSRSWINIYKKDTQKSTHKQIKKKQNKTYKTKTKQNNYTNCDFPGYSKCGKNILWLFFLWLFFLLVLWLFILWLFSVYHLCIAYIISHLLEEMYENQISVLFKFHVLPWKDKLLSASVIFGS